MFLRTFPWLLVLLAGLTSLATLGGLLPQGRPLGEPFWRAVQQAGLPLLISLLTLLLCWNGLLQQRFRKQFAATDDARVRAEREVDRRRQVEEELRDTKANL